MVHRVDGPIGAYRGFDDGTDARLVELNRELANATVLQSRYSLEKHRELGLELRDPVVIPNAVDPAIFHAPAAREPLDGRKARIIASSWSFNPRKGSETLAWLDRHLDRERFELTFVGQTAGSVRPHPDGRSGGVGRGRGPAAGARRLSRSEPGRSVLERPARSARLWAACGRFSRAEGTPSSWATEASGSATTSRSRRSSRGLSPRSMTRRAAISVPAISDRGGQVPRSARVGAYLESRGGDELRPASPECSFAADLASLPARDHGAGPRRLLHLGLEAEDVLARHADPEEPARPMGLPGDHVRDPSRSRRRDRHLSGWKRRSIWRRCVTCSARAR